MQHLRERLAEITEANQPATVRQVFYRAVSEGLIPKSEATYKTTVVRLLGDMRLSGRIPFHWIADGTRWVRKPTTFDSIEDALQQTARLYRRALWSDQDVRIEVWLEKEALAGVIVQETEKYDVPLYVTRGYASLSYLYAAAQAIASRQQSTHIYYFGDLDPSGLDIARNVEARLREFVCTMPALNQETAERWCHNRFFDIPRDAGLHFHRIAVTEAQVEEYGLLTRPTKQTDSRSAKFSGESVEVDAIDPPTLRELVTDAIVQHIDQDALDVVEAAERSEREILLRMAGSEPVA